MNSAAKKTQRITYICSSCGSYDVVVDAWAEWDVANQRWRAAEIFESTAYCRKCDGECSIRESPVRPNRGTALRAIAQ